MLLNVGPTHDGRIIPIFQERLMQMGEFLNPDRYVHVVLVCSVMTVTCTKEIPFLFPLISSLLISPHILFSCE